MYDISTSSPYIEVLTKIDLLRGALRGLHFFSLSTLTVRRSPLRTAERARMPGTAFSVFFFFSKFKFVRAFWGDVEILASLMFKTPVFWEHGIPPGHTPPFVSCGTVQLFFERNFHHTRGPSLRMSAWLVTSSTQLRPAAYSASSAAQRRAVPFPGVPCRTVRHCAMLCDAVRCCAVRVVCFAVYLLSFC